MRLSSLAVAALGLLVVGCAGSLPKAPLPIASSPVVASAAPSVAIELHAETCDVESAPASVADPIRARAESSFARRGSSAAVHFFDRDPEDVWELISINGFRSTDDGLAKIELVDGYGHGLVLTVPTAPGRYVCGRDGVRIDERVSSTDEATPGTTDGSGACEILVAEGATKAEVSGRFKALMSGGDMPGRTIDVGYFVAEKADDAPGARASLDLGAE